MSFSNDNIKILAPGQTLYDEGSKASVKGLHIRCLATGSKSFMFYYRTRAGQQRRPKIGDFPDITIAEARSRARAIANRVAIGEDPKGIWDAQRGERTIGDLYIFTLEKLWSQPRFIESKRDRDVKGLWKNHLKKKFGEMKISEATTVEIKNWHTDLSHIPYTANRTLEVLSRIISFSQEHGKFPLGPNPCQYVTPHSEKKRKRYASTDETEKIVAILHREYPKKPLGVTFLFAMMMTGSRPIALEKATWDQLQITETDGKKWGILTFKGKTTEETGEDETVVFPPMLMEMVLKLPRIEGGTIFSCKMPKRLWGDIQKEVGCTDLRARDWRRWFATVGMSNGVQIGSIAELLNHRSTQTTKTYAQLNLDARILAAAAIAKEVGNIVTKPVSK